MTGLNNIAVQQEPSHSGISNFLLLLNGHHIIETRGLPSQSLFLGSQSMLVLFKLAYQHLLSTLTAPECNDLPQRPLSKRY